MSEPIAATETSRSPLDPIRKPERNATATRQRLLDIAEAEFAARGFAGARLREIALAAHVQPALIHHYFVDKVGLYRAVIDRGIETATTQSLALFENVRHTDDLLAGFVRMLVYFCSENQNVLAILRHEAVSGSRTLIDVFRQRTKPILDRASVFIGQRQAAGELRSDLTATEIIVFIISLSAFPFVEAGIATQLFDDAVPVNPAALEQRIQSIVNVIRTGVMKQAQ